MTLDNEKFTLIAIDCQNDFSKKDGKMYIDKAEQVIDNISAFIKDNKKNIHQVIFVKDNHGPKHLSFRSNGGIWPEHCVEETEGNKINQVLIDTCEKNNVQFRILNKGEVDNFEEYSISSYSEHVDGTFVLKTLTDKCRIYTDDIVLCGMPGNTSVASSAKDLINQLGQERISIFINGIASMDENNEIMKLIEDNVDVNIMYNSNIKF